MKATTNTTTTATLNLEAMDDGELAQLLKAGMERQNKRALENLKPNKEAFTVKFNEALTLYRSIHAIDKDFTPPNWTVSTSTAQHNRIDNAVKRLLPATQADINLALKDKHSPQEITKELGSKFKTSGKDKYTMGAGNVWTANSNTRNSK